MMITMMLMLKFDYGFECTLDTCASSIIIILYHHDYDVDCHHHNGDDDLDDDDKSLGHLSP